MDGSYFPQLEDVKAARETVWENPKLLSFDEAAGRLPLDNKDIDDAESRLLRFAPFIAQRFPETAGSQGIIESPLTEIPAMKQILNERFGAGLKGRLFLKQDSELPIAGSVKARGGIYEVLKHTEELALQSGLLKDDYRIFDTEESRQFFSRYAIHVGSTGNLGLSIGIMSAAIGYRAFVHMSEDARQWKKDLLRSKGVTVIEYKTDYSMAVVEGRKKAAQDPFSYFVDDENSQDLFLGYAVAARRLKKQLQDSGITVDKAHPLFVYIPCGVGGAPGGICFGIKQEFGDDVFCIFEEPVQAPCMLLGMATGLQDGICVQDVGLSGKTAADGLAVGRPSKFVGKAVENLLSGIVTIEDRKLFELMRALLDSESIFIEPSACAAFQGAIKLKDMTMLMSSLGSEQLKGACHIIWATGGSMVPEDEKQRYIDTI